jgi:hypothetical protein
MALSSVETLQPNSAISLDTITSMNMNAPTKKPNITHIELGHVEIQSGKQFPPDLDLDDVLEGESDCEDDSESPAAKIDFDEVVIGESSIKINYSYPFKNPRTATYECQTGFTRNLLIKIICAKYHAIYNEELQLNKILVEEMKAKGLNTGYQHGTLGEWGIYGHSIGQLVLHSMQLKNGVWELGIDS